MTSRDPSRPKPRRVDLDPSTADGVARAFGLGDVEGVSLAARGWVSLNVTWRIATSTGLWAIKEIARESPDQLEAAAAIELAAADKGVQMPRLRWTTEGAVAARVEGRVFRCHEFVVGDVPTGDLRVDAQGAGAALGRIHRALLAWDPVLMTTTVFGEQHWIELVGRGEQLQAPWTDQLRRALPRIADAETKARAWTEVDRGWIGSHRDVRPDNTLRVGDRLLLVDWDGAGPVVAGREVAGALRWWHPHEAAFLQAYVDEAGEVDLDEGAGEDGGLVWWLETNVQHALELPGDEERAWAVAALAASFMPS